MNILTFLGTGNAFAEKARRRSVYLVEASLNYLIDCGPDTMIALQEKNLTLLDIDVIIISHLHPDHYLALPQFALEDYYVLKRLNPVDVYGPIGLYDKLLEVTRILYNEEVSNHINKLYRIHEFGENETFEIPKGKITTLPAIHSGNGRMQKIFIENFSIGYTGDTAFHKESFKSLLECDIVITEASSSGFEIPDHTTLQDLLNADIPKNKEVYLTHYGYSVERDKDLIKAPLYLAYDGLDIEL
ncbi:MAG: MBL fold metallo-hydrolase [Candidatus Heimdallarchaeota archaeon]|nr:MBL fold metallo-hydrolase [Candidatus Heimdallarchaeota archaeon]